MADEDSKPGLNRARLAAAALALLDEHGLDGLTMRRLADRTGVKPASLYWHVRDRGELIGLVAQALLDAVPPPPAAPDWRAHALAVCATLRRAATARRDAARILRETIDVLERSPVHARLAAVIAPRGLTPAEAHEAATMMLTHVLVRAADAGPAPAPRQALVAVDTGSRGVTLRAGPPMTGLLRAADTPDAPAPAVIRGDTVTVRRRRGGGQGELELNPQHQWSVKIHAPTWNTVLDLSGLDVRAIEIDGGATRVDCVLPPPTRPVTIHVAGGVVGLRLRRAPGVKVVADISTGALHLRLDDRSVLAATSDLHWESPGPATPHHYLLKISGGATRITVEEDPTITAAAPGPAVVPDPGDTAALALVLDGVAARDPG